MELTEICPGWYFEKAEGRRLENVNGNLKFVPTAEYHFRKEIWIENKYKILEVNYYPNSGWFRVALSPGSSLGVLFPPDARPDIAFNSHDYQEVLNAAAKNIGAGIGFPPEELLSDNGHKLDKLWAAYLEEQHKKHPGQGYMTDAAVFALHG